MVFFMRKVLGKLRPYLEMTPSECKTVFPDIWSQLPLCVRIDMLNDFRYVVRCSQDGLFEFGYPDDEWSLR